LKVWRAIVGSTLSTLFQGHWRYSRLQANHEESGMRILSAAIILVLAGCGPKADGPGAARPTVPEAALNAISGDQLLADIKILASDSFLGRGPGTLGEDRTVEFLEREFRAIGFEPGNPDGSFIQKVPLVGITPDPASTLVVYRGGEARTLRFRDDVVAWTRHVSDVAVRNSEMVFVGYGVQAPEYNWDDFKDLDAKGKTLVMLVNDPPVPDPNNPSGLDSTVFGGKAMTYYGRWTYKYEQGMRHGADAVILIHETEPAGYPFTVVQGMGGERFNIIGPDNNASRSKIEAWITLEQAKSLLSLAGQDFDQLKARAATREFAPVPLGLTASMNLKSTRRTVESRNVIAKLTGSDPVGRDEYVIYTAHWDHFGVGAAINGDSIYNGAFDNATGTAALLAFARAFKALPTPPRRTVVMLAVTAEEQGLLGSQYYAERPLYPLAQTVANINVDGVNVDGRTSDVTVIGLGASELDDEVQAAAAIQKRTVRPDAEPEKGYYYRSDHFNFAKVGVPALYTDGGVDFVGESPDYGTKARERYIAEDYHKPSDEVKPFWRMDGAVDDLRLLLKIGYWLAESDRFPEWRPGNEFKPARDAQRPPR